MSKEVWALDDSWETGGENGALVVTAEEQEVAEWSGADHVRLKSSSAVSREVIAIVTSEVARAGAGSSGACLSGTSPSYRPGFHVASEERVEWQCHGRSEPFHDCDDRFNCSATH